MKTFERPTVGLPGMAAALAGVAAMGHSAAVLTVLGLTVMTAPSLAAPGAGSVERSGIEGSAGERGFTAKGIYHDYDQHQQMGVAFSITMDDGRRVPTTWGFHSGDRFTFGFEINTDAHIYIINRTKTVDRVLHSSEFTSKRITREFDDGYGGEDRRSERHASVDGSVDDRRWRARHRPPEPPPTYEWRLSEPRLLFPTVGAGSNNRLRAGEERQIPHRGYFAMDDDPGTEKLYLVISANPIDFSEVFDDHGEVLKRPGTSRIDGRAITRLEASLASWTANTQADLVPKGIFYDPGTPAAGTPAAGAPTTGAPAAGTPAAPAMTDCSIDAPPLAREDRVDDPCDTHGYGITIDPNRPAVIEIDLEHY